MIIMFCGHSAFNATENHYKTVMMLLEERIGDTEAEIYLGDYGAFDSFAYRCAVDYKKTHPKISLVFVTPYISPQYLQSRLAYEKGKYDSILYPEIEGKPLRYAISYRNRYMVEKADIVIAYVSHTWGGAYKTLSYARQKGKEIINLFEL